MSNLAIEISDLVRLIMVVMVSIEKILKLTFSLSFFNLVIKQKPPFD